MPKQTAASTQPAAQSKPAEGTHELLAIKKHGKVIWDPKAEPNLSPEEFAARLTRAK